MCVQIITVFRSFPNFFFSHPNESSVIRPLVGRLILPTSTRHICPGCTAEAVQFRQQTNKNVDKRNYRKCKQPIGQQIDPFRFWCSSCLSRCPRHPVSFLQFRWFFRFSGRLPLFLVVFCLSSPSPSPANDVSTEETQSMNEKNPLD